MLLEILIDRAARYITLLLKADYNVNKTYSEVVTALFKELETLKENESVVLKTSEHLSRS